MISLLCLYIVSCVSYCCSVSVSSNDSSGITNYDNDYSRELSATDNNQTETKKLIRISREEVDKIMKQLIQNDSSLYTRVLMYEPIQLSEFIDRAITLGYYPCKNDVKKYLNSECIVFQQQKWKWTKTRRKRRRRKRKPVARKSGTRKSRKRISRISNSSNITSAKTITRKSQWKRKRQRRTTLLPLKPKNCTHTIKKAAKKTINSTSRKTVTRKTQRKRKRQKRTTLLPLKFKHTTSAVNQTSKKSDLKNF